MRQCATLLSLKAARMNQVWCETAEDHWRKSFWNIHGWPPPITYSHRKLPWRRFCETRTAMDCPELGISIWSLASQVTQGGCNNWRFQHVSNPEVNSHRLYLHHASQIPGFRSGIWSFDFARFCQDATTILLVRKAGHNILYDNAMQLSYGKSYTGTVHII